MAIYNYVCDKCKSKFDVTVSCNASEEERLKQVCPKCNTSDNVRREWGIAGMYISTIGGHGRKKI